jgi:chemotaxis protein MotB
MARKKKHEEHENHERWLVSYADFITLLFAFFVVMYSISSVNEGKYRVLSSTLVTAFSHPAKTLDPIQYGTPLRAPVIQHKLLKQEDKDADPAPRIGVDYQVMPTTGQMAQMEKIADEVKHNMKKLIDEGLVDVNKTNKGVEIAINSEILFASGQAHLGDSAQEVLQRIAGLLKPQNNHINVEGYTDNVPINTPAFPSNWELSAARAASVVHLFTNYGIEPQRLAAIGFGEFRPVASNTDDEGRRKNRRVAIMVLNEPFEDKIKLDDVNKTDDSVSEISQSFKGRAGQKEKADKSRAQGAGLVVLPLPVKERDPATQGDKPAPDTKPLLKQKAPVDANRSNTPLSTKPIVLGAPDNKASNAASQTNTPAPAPMDLPPPGARGSFIQLPPTNVISKP